MADNKQVIKRPSSTGINGLDLAIQGGYRAGSVILIKGSACSGVEHLAGQFWLSGKKRVLYFMLDGEISNGMIDATNQQPFEMFSVAPEQGIIVDSISTLIMRYGIEEVLESISAGKGMIRETGGHILGTLYTDLHKPYEEILLERACDMVVELNENIHGNEIIRTLAVKKISGIPTPKRVLPFIIKPSGIELSTTSRVV